MRAAGAPAVVRELAERTPRAAALLAGMPYSVPFRERLTMFSAAVAAVRAQHQPRGARGNTVRIRRGYVLEDGLARIHRLSAEAMKERLHVIYVNDHGLDEPGIDLGGLFKEFWNDLSAQTFDVNFGLFRTNAESLLYPNPTSRTAH